MNTNLFTNVLCVNANLVERAYSFKFIGIRLSIILNGVLMLIQFCAKASSRLYFLKILKRSFFSTDDLLYFYT